jgi:prepilin-type N-terminal cleavage/methylation domain-containing protein
VKKAFTMIELIFVIVILGILAAVAVPKMLAMAKGAKQSKIAEYSRTVSDTVAAQAWTNTVPTETNGSLANLRGDKALYTYYVQWDKNFVEAAAKNGINTTTLNDANLSKTVQDGTAITVKDSTGNTINCSTGNFKALTATDGTKIVFNFNDNNYTVAICDSDKYNAPIMRIINCTNSDCTQGTAVNAE